MMSGEIRPGKARAGTGISHGTLIDRTALRTGKAALLLAIGWLAPISQAEVGVSERFIEELIVTAEKRETSIDSLPLAVTALGQEELAVRGIEGISDLQFAAPGLVFNIATDTAQVTIRGVGVDFTTMDSEPGVALYADGVYRGGLVSQGGLMFDLERIEVVRGPQGTLNGRNSTGGSVNMVSRLPGAEAGFEASMLYGSYDRYRVDLSGDLPLSDVLAVRAAVAVDSRDGYADNNFLGTEPDDAKYTVGKFAAVYTPVDELEVILRAEVTDSERSGPAFIKTQDVVVPPLGITLANPGGALTVPNSFCGPISCEDALGLTLTKGGIGSSNPRELFADLDQDYNLDSSGFSATVNWQAGDGLQIRSISSYFELENDNRDDIDGSEIAAVHSITISDIEEFSQELTLIGTSGDLDWIVGGYYYSSEIDELYSFDLPALQATFEAVFGIFGGLGGPLPPGSLAFFGSRIDGSTTGVPFFDNRMLQDTKSVAGYAQGTYNFTDRLRGTAGVRYTRDEKDVAITFVANIGVVPCVGIEHSEDWSEVTGKVGLDADLSDNTLVYGSISRGYKSGGFNAGDCYDPYDPEILLAYEAGIKSSLLDGRMRLNVAAFFYDYTDIQARLFVNNAASVENASEAETYGAELEINWLAAENFRIDGSISLLHTEYQDHSATNPIFPQIGTGCTAGLACLQSIEGNALLRSPELQATLTAEYDLDIGNAGLLTLRGEYAYTDKVYHTIFNDEIASQDGFSLVNARVIWTPGAARMEGISVVGFVENIGDEEYAVSHTANATTGGVQSMFAPPRTWGVQFRYSR